ncbi:hypothetical protein LRS06_05805 [Hymenobacter sp. J193]|uniref:hypothetical protein n=1 Tax=Hymenobacter sp. J193 TaxID=2898429 RepID=UPI0021509D7A|nr:hypothetical protein [Hymenobacter sp. J193]MCR5887302.1 hypothetical protein [Hymenobacter sp. J193]
MRYFYWIFFLTGLTLPTLSIAQSSWPTTRIDEQLTIQMPYAATLEEDTKAADPKLRGVQRFWTSTSDNEFQVFRVDLRYIPNYNPDAVLSKSELSKVYDKASKLFNHKVLKGRLMSYGDVAFAGTFARAALYRGFDEYRQRPINIETIWLTHDHAIYLLTCSYSIPEEEGALADKKRFFSSLHFDDPATTKEL